MLAVEQCLANSRNTLADLTAYARERGATIAN